MTETRATGEQLSFKSQATGEHVLDVYLEAAERGGRTIGDMMADLFATDGTLRSDLVEFRLANTGALQVRLGDWAGDTGWSDVPDAYIFRVRGAHATATAYKRLDVVTYSGSTFLCAADHTSSTAAPGPSFVIALQGEAPVMPTATDIAFTPTGTIAAANTQAALAELDSENQSAHTALSSATAAVANDLASLASANTTAHGGFTSALATKAPLASPALTGTPTVNGNPVFHTGNDGVGSTLDADYLRGYAPTTIGSALLTAASAAAARSTLGAQATLTVQPTAFANSLLDDADAATALTTLGAQPALGFTPIQQGGGAGQGTSKIYIGWSASGLRVQVGSTDYGLVWPISITGSADSATTATSAASATNASKLANVTPSSIGLAVLGAASTSVARDAIDAAPLDSPPFAGTPTAPTPATGTNSTRLATTAFVKAQITSDVNALNLGTAATKDVGTAAGNVLQWSGAASRYPAGDARNLYALPLIPDVWAQDQKASGTLPQTIAGSTWTRRELTDLVLNGIGSSLSSNRIYLPAGTYYARWYTSAWRCREYKSRLWNDTTGTLIVYGSGGYCDADGFNGAHSLGTAYFTLASAAYVSVWQIQTTAIAAGYDGGDGTEIYTDLQVWKIL